MNVSSAPVVLQTRSDRNYPASPIRPIANLYHSIWVKDDFQWLENSKSQEVKSWEMAQTGATRDYLDKHAKISPLIDRLIPLYLFDYKKPSTPVLEGTRRFSFKKRVHQDQPLLRLHGPGNEKTTLLNPNHWGDGQTADFWKMSRDGRYIAIGVAKNGDENSLIRLFDVETKSFLDESCFGRRQSELSWAPHNAGFYYSAHPPKGSVPEGEEEYWNSVYYHQLGTNGQNDVKGFSSQTKEDYHSASFSEDGQYAIFYRTRGDGKNEIFFKRAQDQELVPVTTGFDGKNALSIIDNRLIFTTDRERAMSEVYAAMPGAPREAWQLLIPEDKQFKISSVVPANGKLFVVGMRHACSAIKIYEPDGTFLRELILPAHGTASVEGMWTKPEVHIHFQSFLHPNEIFNYDVQNNRLTSIYKTPIEVDVTKYAIDQVWVRSKDGTQVSMFVMHRRDIKLDGNNPAILAGYGGFDVALTPLFFPPILTWIEAGGVCALPNLRGGGEYGKEWHEAGMREQKQNVFDDFIASAEWLIANNFTSPQKLATFGGSNGGLLVAAAMVQRPELFRAVYCGVPLLDMLRYEQFDLAKIWNVEYGSVEDPELFRTLLSYSPYHNVKENSNYPSILITSSDNDARVNPMHARKMVARLQTANPAGNPILYYPQANSGHSGSPSFTEKMKQLLEPLGFLMNEIGMTMDNAPFVRRVDIYSSVAGLLFKRMVTEPCKGLLSFRAKPAKPVDLNK